MMRNLVKSNASLEEHGWNLLPPSSDDSWDGLLGWYVEYVSKRPEMRKVSYLRERYNAALSALAASQVLV